MKNTLIALHAQTSIHAGTGQNTGTVDLPIQRESHNGYPCIYGSSMKGALRSCALQRDCKDIEILFGKESGGEGFAGSLLVSDARLLLLPVRSLTSQFRWVTCPALLQRLKQDAKRFGTELEFEEIDVDNNNLITAEDLNPNKLYLEEYCFKTKKHEDGLNKLIAVLAQFLNNENAENDLKNQLCVISNDDFCHFSKYATQVRARNVLDSKTKTSNNLWYEETLPPETIMYLGVSADNSRKQGGNGIKNAEDILKEFTGLFTDQNPAWLQVGGNETIGMGWFGVNVLKFDKGE